MQNRSTVPRKYSLGYIVSVAIRYNVSRSQQPKLANFQLNLFKYSVYLLVSGAKKVAYSAFSSGNRKLQFTTTEMKEIN